MEYSCHLRGVFFYVSYHPSLHTNSYYREVNNLLKEATTSDEAREILIGIGKQLVSGKFIK
jgi:hypothetical protein